MKVLRFAAETSTCASCVTRDRGLQGDPSKSGSDLIYPTIRLRAWNSGIRLSYRQIVDSFCIAGQGQIPNGLGKEKHVSLPARHEGEGNGTRDRQEKRDEGDRGILWVHFTWIRGHLITLLYGWQCPRVGCPT